MKVVLTECVVRNVFEKPKMLDDYTMSQQKLITSNVVKLKSSVADYDVVRDKLADFIQKNSTPSQNEHKIFVSEFNENMEYLDGKYENFIECFSFEILRK